MERRLRPPHRPNLVPGGARGRNRDLKLPIGSGHVCLNHRKTRLQRPNAKGKLKKPPATMTCESISVGSGLQALELELARSRLRTYLALASGRLSSSLLARVCVLTWLRPPDARARACSLASANIPGFGLRVLELARTCAQTFCDPNTGALRRCILAPSTIAASKGMQICHL